MPIRTPPPPRSARLLAAGLTMLAAAAVPVAADPAAPWEAGPFLADPAAMIAAATRADAGTGEGGAVILYSETRLRFEEDGRVARTEWMVYRILSSKADASWSAVTRVWSPWHQDRPEVRARVVTLDGEAHPLDPATLTESAVAQEADLFDDARILRAPLPAANPGAVVETEVALRDTAPYFEGGTVEHFLFRTSVPVRHARLIVDAPAGLPLRHVVRELPEDGFREETADGRRRLQFEYRDIAPYKDIELRQPPEARWVSYVALSTGDSWASVAQRYSNIVEEAVRDAGQSSEIKAFLRAASVPGASQRETLDRLLARLGTEVRYTGIEMGEGKLVPRPPAETLRRKFGDCKDKAVLLTALLRALGIPAHVALIDSSEQRLDIEESLPGMAFNHAIVVIPGTPDLWIDPTARYARAGELPAADQGRLALIASSTAEGLVRAPEATAADNRIVVSREFFLSDLGPAHIVETTDAWGENDRNLRAQYATQDEKPIREFLTRYLQGNFRSDKLGKLEHTEPADLARPFRVRLEGDEAKRGWTDMQSAVVAVFPGAPLIDLPAELSAGEEGATEKPRKSGYYLSVPYLEEIHYRAVPPAGFRALPPPPGRVRHFGPATLSEEFALADDGTLTATVRFELDRRRLTAEEFQAVREGVLTVSKEDAALLQFEQVGESLLAAGQVREALVELRRLAAQSPKKALPRIRLARTLLAGGMGESAREEAKSAVALEPAFAPAYATLAWILQHDEVGRRFGDGFDRAAALAAYRKAKELDPKDGTTRGDLAILLEYNEKGQRYAKGSDLPAAIEEYQALRADLDETSLNDNLLYAYLYAGRFTELKQRLTELGPSETRTVLRLVAVAVLEGTDAAAREAGRGSSSGDARRNALVQAADLLVQARRYPEAAALLEGAARQAPNAAELLTRVEMLRKVGRHEELTFALDEPTNVARRLFVLLGTSPFDAQQVEALVSRDLIRDLGVEQGEETISTIESTFGPSSQGMDDFSPDILLDIMLTVFRPTVTGDEATGYRVALSTPFSDERPKVFVVREGQEYRLTGHSGSVEWLGLEALRRLDRGDLRSARQWLDWAREDVHNAGGEDPLSSSPFAALWAQGGEAGEAEARCAAASLLAGSRQSEKMLPALLACRDAAPEGDRRTALDLALALAYGASGRYTDQAETAGRLAAAFPRSDRAYNLREGALWKLARWDEVRRFAEERQAAGTNDPLPWLSLFSLADQQGDLDAAEKALQRIVAGGHADATALNNLAWLALFCGKVDDEAIEHGQRAVALDQYQSSNSLHTLASLYAEVGKTAEAYKLILQAMGTRSDKRPETEDWYVFGRLAEDYGLPEVSRRYYARVTPPESGDAEATSTYRLARQRLAAIGPETKKAEPARR